MSENRAISDLSDQEWKNVRNNYHIPNQGMPAQYIREVLYEVDDILKSHNIKYFLSCGTALGLHRDGDFIPWDDEIDIEIFSESFAPVLAQLRESFIEKGFIARATFRGNTSKMPVFKHGIKVALSSLYHDGNGFRCDLNQKFPERFYDNPDTYTLDDRDFRIPGPIEEYLTFYYGDWKVPIKSYDVNEYLNKDKKWRK